MVGLGSVVATRDGGLLVTGAANDPLSRAAWIGRFGEDGSLTWSTMLDGLDDPASEDRASYAVESRDGTIVVAGTSQVLDRLEPWLAGLHPDGRLAWQWKYLDAAAWRTPQLIVEAPDGGWTVGGSSQAPLQTAWLMHVGPDASIAWQRSGTPSAIPFVEALPDGYLVTAKGFIAGQGHQFIAARTGLDGLADPGCLALGDSALVRQATAFASRTADVVFSDEYLAGVRTVIVPAESLPDVACDPCPGGALGEVSDVVAGDAALRVAADGASVRVEDVVGATAYNLYVDRMGSWSAPGSTCALRTWTVNGDGTIALPVSWSAPAWVIVTASSTCDESEAGSDSRRRERSTQPSWASCGPAP